MRRIFRILPPAHAGRSLLLTVAALALPAVAAAQASAPAGAHGSAAVPSVRAGGGVSAPLALDGVLDDAAWAAAPAATGFRQTDPREGEPATQPTEVRFVVDGGALWIGARMHDAMGAAGVRSRLARRDQSVDADWLEITFDSFHDHAGRTILRIYPSGLKHDAGQASSYADPSWDPVWEAATRIDSAGWTAEMRIPLSQLRFPRDSVQTWGLQINRYVDRLAEWSQWSFWGKQENGGPPRFGHLTDLRITERPRGFELMPYAVARASYVTPTDAANPFQSARVNDYRVGADFKMLLGSNLTLSATVNPDFGQVEVDPAVVNLSAFETFYDEKRPFFVEGSGLLSFGGFSCRFCSNVSSLSLFYSRRIGRRPQGWLTDDEPADFVHTPENSAILGAAKLTGQAGRGWQVGVLNAVTRAERVQAQRADGSRLEREVEPLSNYLVARVRNTSRGGNLTVGALATSVTRRFEADLLRTQIPTHAEAVGVDWSAYWGNRTYRFMGSVAGSNVEGHEDAILRLQTSSARYFQRPDREAGRNGFLASAVDSSATALRGYGAYLRLAKEAGDWRWESMLNVRSPGFEVNDLAFLTRADYAWMNANLWRNFTRPTRWYRASGFTVGAQQQVNWDGDPMDRQFHASAWADFLNYTYGSLFVILRPESYDDRLTRGGAVVRKAANGFVQGSFSTDSRRMVHLGTDPSYGWNAEGGFSYGLNLNVVVKPASNVQLSVRPSFSRNDTRAQYVTAFSDASATGFYGRRAIFADLSQRTLSMDTRLNVTFSPRLSLELFAQPFVATGNYGAFKEFVRPRELEKAVFGPDRLTPVLDEDGHATSYALDADGDPATEALTWDNPDFTLRSLRGNAVVRWEYRPGSTLFFVWQQSRAGDGTDGDFAFSRDAGAVFRERPDNVFVVKASFWMGR